MSFSSTLQKFKDLFESEKKVLAVYLFGSLASGWGHPRSDVDIAFLLEKGCEDLWPQIEEKWFQIFEKELRKDVDLIFLNEASTILKHHVIVGGECVWERDPKERKQFELRTLNEYLDFKEDRRILEEAFLKSMGVSHGR